MQTMIRIGDEEARAFVAPFPSGIHGRPGGSPGEHWLTGIPAGPENVRWLAATRHSDGRIRVRNPGYTTGPGALAGIADWLMMP